MSYHCENDTVVDDLMSREEIHIVLDRFDYLGSLFGRNINIFVKLQEVQILENLVYPLVGRKIVVRLEDLPRVFASLHIILSQHRVRVKHKQVLHQNQFDALVAPVKNEVEKTDDLGNLRPLVQSQMFLVVGHDLEEDVDFVLCRSLQNESSIVRKHEQFSRGSSSTFSGLPYPLFVLDDVHRVFDIDRVEVRCDDLRKYPRIVDGELAVDDRTVCLQVLHQRVSFYVVHHHIMRVPAVLGEGVFLLVQSLLVEIVDASQEGTSVAFFDLVREIGRA